MEKLFCFIVILVVFGCVYSQNDTELEFYRRIAQTVCKPNLAADKTKILAECDAQVSQRIKTDVFGYCAKQVLKVPKMTQPILCYQDPPNSNKYSTCIQRTGRVVAKRIGVNFNKARAQISNDYRKCAEKLV